jgi:hypothetical protein
VPSENTSQDQNRWTGIVDEDLFGISPSRENYRLVGLSSALHGSLPWTPPSQVGGHVALRNLYRAWRTGWGVFRRALDHLDDRGLVDLDVHPGVISHITVRPGWLIHARNDSQHFTALSSAMTTALLDEHGLSVTQVGICVRLAVEGKGHFESVSSLVDHLGIGYRATRHLVDLLVRANLCEQNTAPGHRQEISLRLEHLYYDMPERPVRFVRRRAERQARSARSRDPKAHLAAVMLQDAFDELTSEHVPALRSACAGLIAYGWEAQEIVQHITGMGSLSQASSPLAVVLSRIQHAIEELRAGQEARQWLVQDAEEINSLDDLGGEGMVDGEDDLATDRSFGSQVVGGIAQLRDGDLAPLARYLTPERLAP